MLSTEHRIVFSDARDLSFIDDQSVDIIVTSPPYPMIKIWDELFCLLNPEVKVALEGFKSKSAFELMHKELDKVWSELFRVVRDGGFACINIGDATRSIGGKFQLYSNHSRVINYCTNIGFDALPVILWRKQTNAPNKFMGSGMLPAGAYVTLEHEYILVFRKGLKRSFSRNKDKITRKQSSFFWEERNKWFSDIWDFKGIKQDLRHKDLRNRSSAYPFELAYRLINMYSAKGDTVLDPFLGTGTTMFAAIASCRNSLGVEIDDNFKKILLGKIKDTVPVLNNYISGRFNGHLTFIDNYRLKKGPLKHTNKHYNFSVMTQQETELLLHYIKNITITNDSIIKVEYLENAVIKPVQLIKRKKWRSAFESKQLEPAL